MWSSYSLEDKNLLFKRVMNEKLTKKQAISGDLPFYYRSTPCVKCGSNIFRVSKSGACYQCSSKSVKSYESKKLNSNKCKSLALSVDDKLERLRLARELRDFD